MEIDLTIEEIERLHDEGKMPDWWYYQVNGKTAGENFVTIYNKQQKKTIELLNDYRMQRNLDAIVEKELDKQMPKIIDKALADAFKSFGK